MTPPAPSPIPNGTREARGECLQDLATDIRQGRFEHVLNVTEETGLSEEACNLRGICMLRLGKLPEAETLFRNLVEVATARGVRPDLLDIYRANLATASLMNGNVMACRYALSQIEDPHNATAAQLSACISRWERGLSWWQRLNWRSGAVEPTDGPIAIDFTPGDSVALRD